MSACLRITLILTSLWANLSCAADTYEGNPATAALIDEMVQTEGFDRQQF